MFDLPGPHFALSELLIVAAAALCGITFGKAKLWLACVGSVFFGMIAAVGAYRFGMDRVDALAEFHGALSQVGGAAAMSLIAAQLALLGIAAGRGVRFWVFSAVAMCAVLAVALPPVRLPLFVIWLAVAIGSAALLPADSALMRSGRALLVAIFLLNISLVRQSPLLGPGLSWHLFHLLVAIWLVCLLKVFPLGDHPDSGVLDHK